MSSEEPGDSILFELTYSIISWAAWLPNLLVAKFAVHGRHDISLKPTPLRGSA